MLSSTLWRALATPVTYALLAVLIATAVMQVRYVNKALQRFDSTQVIPVQFVMFTLSVIIGSAILYRDFEKATADNFTKFIGGCLLTFFGVWLITSGRPKQDEGDVEDSESEDGGEERIGLMGQEHAGEDVRNKCQRRARVYHNGDGAGDDQGPMSPRSSHVCFVDPSERPRSPRTYSNSSFGPPVRVKLSTQGNSDDSPLISNPWVASSDDDLLQPPRHPGLQSTISSPVLPSEALNASEPLLHVARTMSQGNVHTHPNEQQSPAPPQADRPMTPARHSISRILPGPLLSPLSGGFSAVVADSLRRGLDPRSGSFKRSKLGLRRTKSGSQRLTNTTDDDDDHLVTLPPKNGDLDEEVSKAQEDDGGRVTRARSFSNTLGELLRSGRQRPSKPNTNEDEEAGPSGS